MKRLALTLLVPVALLISACHPLISSLSDSQEPEAGGLVEVVLNICRGTNAENACEATAPTFSNQQLHAGYLIHENAEAVSATSTGVFAGTMVDSPHYADFLQSTDP